VIRSERRPPGRLAGDLAAGDLGKKSADDAEKLPKIERTILVMPVVG
jgi:hypothetical protein